MSDVFVSYAREDQAFVRWLNRELTAGGQEVWVDWESLAPSAKWRQEIRAAVEAANTVIFVGSPDSAASEVCAEELEIGVELNKRILPVVCRDLADTELPEAVAAHHWVFCRTKAERDAAIPRVLEALDTDLDWVNTHTRLLVRSREWEQQNEDRSLLLRGSDLRAAEAALVDHASDRPAPTDQQRRYVLASRQGSTHRVRILAGIALAAVLVIAALAVVALISARRATDQAHRAEAATRRAEVGRLVSDSSLLASHDRPLSAALAVTASRLADTAATRGALADVLTAEPRLRASLTGRSRPYSNQLALPADGSRLVARGPDHLDVFDLRTGRLAAARVKIPRGAGLAASPDGRLLAIGSQTGEVRILDARSLRLDGSPLHATAPVASVAFSPDGSTIATASAVFGSSTSTPTERSAQLWDVATRQPRPLSLTGHLESVYTVAFSPDGRLLATGGNDRLVVLHDSRSGATVGTPLSIDSEVYSIAFSPDGRFLAVGGQSSNVFVFDLRVSAPVGPPLAAQGILNPVAFSPDGTRLVTSGGKTTVWDTTTWKPVGGVIDVEGTAVAYRPGGEGFAISGFNGVVSLWDPDAAPLISRPIRGAPPFGGQVSPDGRTLAIPDVGAVTLYDARTLRPLGAKLRVAAGPSLDVGVGPIPAIVAFARDGRRLAVTGLGGTVQIFDVATLRPIGGPVPLPSPAVSLAFSPDGSLLAVGGTQHDVSLIDPATGRRRGPLQPEPPNFVVSVAFSPDGRRLLATSSITQDVVYDHLGAATPAGRAVPALQGQAIAAAYSPNGSLLATSGVDGSLVFRNGRTLAPRGAPVAANSTAVIRLAFSPTARFVATADITPAVRLVDVATGQPIGHALAAGGVNAPSFGHDYALLSVPGGTAILTLNLKAWQAAACRLAGRNLTRAEDREYLSGSGRHIVPCPGEPTPS